MVATLNGQRFSIDPSSVSFNYQVHLSEEDFIGGKVVQIFGGSISDIQVQGSFSGGSFEEQLKMLSQMRKLSALGIDAANYRPYRFTWPEQGWDFEVLVKAFTSPDGSKSVVHRPTVFAPKWRLTLFPVGGSSSLKEAIVTTAIDRLRDGLGWQLTTYNGSLDIRDAQAALLRTGTTSIDDFASIAFGSGGVPATSTQSTSSLTGLQYQTEGVLTVDQMLNLARSAGFKGNAISIAVAIAKGESGWNPNAHNGDRSTGDDSWGLWQINMLAHGDRFGSSEELRIPERNAAAAFALYTGRGGTFADWSVYKSNDYLNYLPEIQARANELGIG